MAQGFVEGGGCGVGGGCPDGDEGGGDDDRGDGGQGGGVVVEMTVEGWVVVRLMRRGTSKTLGRSLLALPYSCTTSSAG